MNMAQNRAEVQHKECGQTHTLCPSPPDYFSFIHIKEPPSSLSAASLSLLFSQKAAAAFQRGSARCNPILLRTLPIKEANKGGKSRPLHLHGGREEPAREILRAALLLQFVEASSFHLTLGSRSQTLMPRRFFTRCCAISASDRTWQLVRMCFAAGPPQTDPCQETKLSVWSETAPTPALLHPQPLVFCSLPHSTPLSPRLQLALLSARTLVRCRAV